MVLCTPLWNYKHICTARTYGILNVKNALVPTFCLLLSEVAYTLCNPVFKHEEIQEGCLASRVINQNYIQQNILSRLHSRNGYSWSNFFGFCEGWLWMTTLVQTSLNFAEGDFDWLLLIKLLWILRRFCGGWLWLAILDQTSLDFAEGDFEWLLLIKLLWILRRVTLIGYSWSNFFGFCGGWLWINALFCSI